MIVVTVELWPQGDRKKRQIIGTAEIAIRGQALKRAGIIITLLRKIKSSRHLERLKTSRDKGGTVGIS